MLCLTVILSHLSKESQIDFYEFFIRVQDTKEDWFSWTKISERREKWTDEAIDYCNNIKKAIPKQKNNNPIQDINALDKKTYKEKDKKSQAHTS